jgi:hypothetical protein
MPALSVGRRRPPTVFAVGTGRPASHAGSFFQSAIEDLEFYALIAGHHKIEVSSSSSKMGTGPMGRF